MRKSKGVRQLTPKAISSRPGRSHECTVKDCPCVHFEADAEQESSFVCMCGHVEEEHGDSP